MTTNLEDGRSWNRIVATGNGKTRFYEYWDEPKEDKKLFGRANQLTRAQRSFPEDIRIDLIMLRGVPLYTKQEYMYGSYIYYRQDNGAPVWPIQYVNKTVGQNMQQK